MGSKGSKVTLQVLLLGKKQVESLVGECSPPLGRTHCITCLHWLEHIIVVVKAAELFVVLGTF